MLMEYIAKAMLAERQAELQKCWLAEEAARLTPRRSWASRLVRRAGAPNRVRSAGAAGPSAQSLSIAE